MFDLLNVSYSPLFGYTELSDRQIDTYLKRYLPLLDLRMLSVVENEKGELVGVAITMPSLSQALRKSKGRLWPLGWFYLLRALKWRREEKAEMVSGGRSSGLPRFGSQCLILQRPDSRV